MYYWDFKYSNDNDFIISSDTFKKTVNEITEGFLAVKIFASDKTPIENANIGLFEPDGSDGYIVMIDASGYGPVQINNVQFLPNLTCTLKVKLIPSKLNNQIIKPYQIFDLPPYENIQAAQNVQVPQEEVREMSLSLGIDSPKDTVLYLYAEKFAEEVNALSDGKMKIEIYTDAKLGTDR